VDLVIKILKHYKSKNILNYGNTVICRNYIIDCVSDFFFLFHSNACCATLQTFYILWNGGEYYNDTFFLSLRQRYDCNFFIFLGL